MSDLIKWSQLSRKLSGSDNSIRPNKIPKKYEKDISSLLKALDNWESSIDKQQISNGIRYAENDQRDR